MRQQPKPLGKLIRTHDTSPIFLQRATIVALVSFMFFLVMLAAFYARPQIGYFVLATAFLVVDLFTLIGIWMQKRNSVKVYENGIVVKQFRAQWPELRSVKATNETGITLEKDNGEKVVIGSSIADLNILAESIKSKLSSG